jgi:hypothetical protein
VNTITIQETEHGYTAIVGDRYADHLTWDEALGTAAAFLLKHNIPYVQTREQNEAWRREAGLPVEETNGTPA